MKITIMKMLYGNIFDMDLFFVYNCIYFVKLGMKLDLGDSQHNKFMDILCFGVNTVAIALKVGRDH